MVEDHDDNAAPVCLLVQVGAIFFVLVDGVDPGDGVEQIVDDLV